MPRWLHRLTDPSLWMVVFIGLVAVGFWWDIHDRLTPVTVPLLVVLIYLQWRGKGELPPAPGAPVIPQPIKPPPSPWEEWPLRPLPFFAAVVVLGSVAIWAERSGSGMLPVLVVGVVFIGMLGGAQYWLKRRHERRTVAGASDMPEPTGGPSNER